MATLIAVSGRYCAVAKGDMLDFCDDWNHTVFQIPIKVNDAEAISDVAISPNCKHLALLTSLSKQLLLYDIPAICSPKLISLPRSASKARFTKDSNKILIADKSGDVLIYDVSDEHCKGSKLLGHLSLLLDVLMTDDNKYIITCDRDEKIRVSCYPNTYNIATFCLGHKEFVKHIELLPHNSKYLTSCSGDGTIKLWDYTNGKLCHNIDTNLDISDKTLQKQFVESMDREGVEVNTLPVVHFAVSQSSEDSSLIAVTIFNLNKILIYKVNEQSNGFVHTLTDSIPLDSFPTALQFNGMSLYVYNDTDQTVFIYSARKDTNVLAEKVKMFQDKVIEHESNLINDHLIKVLYKRKYDNLQEYMERKKQRLENKSN